MDDRFGPWTTQQIDGWLATRQYQNWNIEVRGDRVNFYNPDDDLNVMMTPVAVRRLCDRLQAAADEAGEQKALVEASNLRNAIRQALAIIETRRFSNILTDGPLSLVIRTLEESLAAPSRAEPK